MLVFIIANTQNKIDGFLIGKGKDITKLDINNGLGQMVQFLRLLIAYLKSIGEAEYKFIYF